MWNLGSSLREFQLHRCNLTGTIAPELVLPSTLEFMSLHLNNLSGAPRRHTVDGYIEVWLKKQGTCDIAL